MLTTAGQKLLHRARSLKRPKAQEPPSPHKRHISTSSDVSRASSSGSDTATRGNSVEWDPLRLHPSMVVDSSPHMLPRGRRYYHQDPTTEHTLEHDHPQPAAQPGLSLEIHDGFDFGFGKPQAVPEDEDITPRPSAPKSEADLHRRRRRRRDANKEAGGGQEWGPGGVDGFPSSTSRPLPPAGFDEADYFIKRGGWKRRGIVFSRGDDEQEGEDDCFGIP